MKRGVPNKLMLQNNRVAVLDTSLLPSVDQAVSEYHQSGGRLTEPHTFGIDPLSDSPQKALIREESFFRKYPSFDPIFDGMFNENSTLFADALLFFIGISKRLAN